MQVFPTYNNQLKNVSDAVSTGNSIGFVDGNTNPALDDYEYDANGNMVKDRNKGITSITYNHLNLPEQIVFENSNSIEYTYNAAGVKLKKTVVEETATPEVRIEVDYLDGFQYAGEVLNFFPTAEGYIRATPAGNITPGAPPTGYAYSYVFNYTDHLGNVRLSYSMDHLTGKLKILEENHYYPFGLRHEVYLTGTKLDFSRNPGDGIEPEPGLPPLLDYVTRMEYQYKYNGKEWQDELNLNMYAMDMRQYDPAIARWVVHDPIIHFNQSPYSSFDGNPVYWADPSGADTKSWLKDIFNRSNHGDLWTNDGDGSFTNNRSGETSECDDCKAKEGPLKGKVLKNYIGTSFEGNEYIPWHGEFTFGLLYEKDDFVDRISELLGNFEVLEKILNYSGGAAGSITLVDLKKLIKSPYTRTALIAGIATYLKFESFQLNSTQKTMVDILKNYILIGTNSKIYEITIKYNSYSGLGDYTQKSFYTEDGDFLGGWKRNLFKTIQQKPTINNEN